MRSIKNDTTFFLFSILIILAMMRCTSKPDPTQTDAKEPVVDFKAIADPQDSTSEFSQILLRLELLNTHADILKYGIGAPEEHQARLNYYRSDFKNDIFLITKGDTVPCYDVHAERLYMDLNYMNFILTVEHHLSDKDALLIHDIVYTNKSLLVTIDPKMQIQ